MGVQVAQFARRLPGFQLDENAPYAEVRRVRAHTSLQLQLQLPALRRALTPPPALVLSHRALLALSSPLCFFFHLSLSLSPSRPPCRRFPRFPAVFPVLPPFSCLPRFL